MKENSKNYNSSLVLQHIPILYEIVNYYKVFNAQNK